MEKTTTLRPPYWQVRRLTGIGICVITSMFAQVMVFDVASIKPSRPGSSSISETRPGGVLTVHNESVLGFIMIAWGLPAFQIVGSPAWVSDNYDIDAKAESERELSQSEIRAPLQALLKERFALRVHFQRKNRLVYSLVVAKGGPKVRPSDSTSEPSFGGTWRGMIVRGKTMEEFASALAYQTELRAPVIDNTGLAGRYDFRLDFFPGAPQAFPSPGDGATAANRPPAGTQVSVFTALEEELGLKLVSKKDEVSELVIDHIERPTAN